SNYAINKFIYHCPCIRLTVHAYTKSNFAVFPTFIFNCKDYTAIRSLAWYYIWCYRGISYIRFNNYCKSRWYVIWLFKTFNVAWICVGVYRDDYCFYVGDLFWGNSKCRVIVNKKGNKKNLYTFCPLYNSRNAD